MGCDWYDFWAFVSSGPAIMVMNKDIKEVHRPGSSREDDILSDELDGDELRWLLDQTEGFKLYDLQDTFVLFMKENDMIICAPWLSMVPGPYEIEEDYVRFEIEATPQGSNEYRELSDLARKLTPSKKKKMSFQPGRYSFSMVGSRRAMTFQELERPRRQENKNVEDHQNTSVPGASNDMKESNMKPPAVESGAVVPMDFELVIGEGEAKKVFEINKAVLFCAFPRLEMCLAEKVEDAKKLEFPQLDPEVVKLVLDYYCTREGVELQDKWGDWRNRAIRTVVKAFEVEEKSASPASKKAKNEHPALGDPRWLDATFLVGPNKEEVKANRAVLASMNPVLCRILYGTGMISVDPSKPIEWPQFDVQAVRAVFQALVHAGKKEFVVSVENVESAKALVDYILETRHHLKLYYDTHFERKHLKYGSFLYSYNNETGQEGLKW